MEFNLYTVVIRYPDCVEATMFFDRGLTLETPSRNHLLGTEPLVKEGGTIPSYSPPPGSP